MLVNLFDNQALDAEMQSGQTSRRILRGNQSPGGVRPEIGSECAAVIGRRLAAAFK
jgi:hypothetical protein